MEATINSLWIWAATQFNNAVSALKSLWYKFLDLLSTIKDSLCSLISRLKARFSYTSETASCTTSTCVPSRPGEAYTEKVEVHQRKTDFEFAVGSPPRKRRCQENTDNREKEIQLIEDTRDLLGNIAEVMKQDLRATSPADAEKTPSKIRELLDSSETEKLMAGLRTANMGLV